MRSHPVRDVVSVAGIAVAFAMVPLPSYATAIPGGTTSSDDLLVNFDLTNAGAPLPFNSVTVGLFVSSPDANAGDMNGGSGVVGVVIDVFGGLSGQDPVITTLQGTIFSNGLNPHTSTFSDPGITDGVFSIGFRVAPGAWADFDGADAFGEVIVFGEPNSMEGDRTVFRSMIRLAILSGTGTKFECRMNDLMSSIKASAFSKSITLDISRISLLNFSTSALACSAACFDALASSSDLRAAFRAWRMATSAKGIPMRLAIEPRSERIV